MEGGNPICGCCGSRLLPCPLSLSHGLSCRTVYKRGSVYLTWLTKKVRRAAWYAQKAADRASLVALFSSTLRSRTVMSLQEKERHRGGGREHGMGSCPPVRSHQVNWVLLGLRKRKKLM